MLKKMRRRFIGAAMAAFTAVVLTLLCFVNVWNYYSVARQQDATLERLLEVDVKDAALPQDRIVPPFDSMDAFSPEVPYMIRFFSVHLGRDGAVVRVNKNYIASVSETEAEEYAGRVLEKGKSCGYEGGYRYLVSRNGEETAVLFLNSEREMQTVKSLLWITAAIALVSLAVVFVLVVLFSDRAIAPYMKNMEAQKRFITNAGHELKTPLTAIATSADVLAMEYAGSEWVENIRNQAGRLSRLIGDLITLSRLNEENPFPARTAFSLSEVLWEMCEAFAPTARAKGKPFAQEIADGLEITGDRAAIGQMISILLDNALKYSPDGGAISIAARRSGKRAEIAVTNDVDPSRPIDPARIFERFYRADESHSAAVSGTGIGLSIAAATAEAHGGKISAQLNGGTITFRVLI